MSSISPSVCETACCERGRGAARRRHLISLHISYTTPRRAHTLTKEIKTQDSVYAGYTQYF